MKGSAFRSKVVEFYLLWSIRMRKRDLEEEIVDIHTSHLPSWHAVDTQELLLKNGIQPFFLQFRHETFSSGALTALTYAHQTGTVS